MRSQSKLDHQYVARYVYSKQLTSKSVLQNAVLDSELSQQHSVYGSRSTIHEMLHALEIVLSGFGSFA